LLEVSPQVLDFRPGKDLDTLLVHNVGGRDLGFSIDFTATSGGITWLELSPAQGTVEGGGAASVLVRVVNRSLLLPGDYQGKITVTAADLAPEKVLVTMTVGRPILAVDPEDELDFGAGVDTLNLLIKNTGEDLLTYTVKLPGEWLGTDAVLQKQIGPNDPQTVSLTVDRTLVPWYWEGSGELLVTSNGLEDAAHSGSARIKVLVTVDPKCLGNQECTKAGYYCDLSTGDGLCQQKKGIGKPCSSDFECSGGRCEGGICCDKACDGPCSTCNLAGSPGICSPSPTGTLCEDNNACTTGDSCDGGECKGTPVDCSLQDTPCAKAECEPATGKCVAVPPEILFKCAIDGECYGEGDPSPAGKSNVDKSCLVCRPGISPTQWSPNADSCYIDGKCYELGEQVVDECHVCNPGTPVVATSVGDGKPCDDDDNPCTSQKCKSGVCEVANLAGTECDDGAPCTELDACLDGVCAGQPYSCDDGLECTTDLCDGKGGCQSPIVGGFCKIDGACVPENAAAPGSFGCRLCAPDSAIEDWTEAVQDSPCDDDNACTLGDHCLAGSCGGSDKDCEDGLACTGEECDPATGICSSPLLQGWCLIVGVCVQAQEPLSGKDMLCLECNPGTSTDAWTPRNEGLPCDDLSECSQSSACISGACQAQGALCDDGNPCTSDVCGQDDLCSHQNMPDSTPCHEDDVVCTQDVCESGSCAHPVAQDSCLISDVCYATNETEPLNICAACLPWLSQNDWQPFGDGEPCNDGLFCTQDDKCGSGTCAGEKRLCPANQCQVPLCSEDLDACQTEMKEEGTSCDDNDPCTVNDKCAGSACIGTAKDCSDLVKGKPCLEPFCDAGNVSEPGACATMPRAEGLLCDDGLTCTPSSACDEQGGCVGAAMGPQDCESILGNVDPCTAGSCIEPDGCRLDPVAEGTECSLPHGSAQCLGGICSLVGCSADFADCNDQDSDGCETDTTSSLKHCGDCDQTCDLENAVPFCMTGECVVLKCDQGFDDCDAMDVNGCETAISDDPENCGKCGLVCGAPGMRKMGTCDAGKCGVSDCLPGKLDADGLPGNGCELENVIWVDGVNGGKPGEDGSFDKPFAKIQKGIDAAVAGKMVYVLSGTYSEALTIAKQDIVLQGDGVNVVVLAVPANQAAGITVTQSGVSVSGMLVSGGRLGIVFAGTQVAPLKGCKATDLRISGQKAADLATDRDAVGIRIDYAEELEVSAVEVQNVTSGAGPQDKWGPCTCILAAGFAYGIKAGHCTNCVFKDNLLHHVTGGSGGLSVFNCWCDSQNCGNGGSARGIDLSNSTQCEFSGNAVWSLTSGKGGGSNCGHLPGQGGVVIGVNLYNTTSSQLLDNEIGVDGPLTGGAAGDPIHVNGQFRACQAGGWAGGFLLNKSTNNTLSGNLMKSLVGGKGNECYENSEVMHHDQPGYGMMINSDSKDNEIDLSNKISGQPIVFLRYAHDVVLDGLTLDASVNPTNWAKLAIFDSKNVKITNSTIFNFQGGSGAGSSPKWAATAGSGGTGVRLENCVGCEVSSSFIGQIKGGPGGQQGGNSNSPKGGDALGIYATAARPARSRTTWSGRSTGARGGLTGATTGHSSRERAAMPRRFTSTLRPI